MLNIEDEYSAYCFDEVALFLEAEATDDKGRTNWNRLKWSDIEKKDNKALIEFIKNH